jgi:hypothetical protein
MWTEMKKKSGAKYNVIGELVERSCHFPQDLQKYAGRIGHLTQAT